MGRQGGMCSHDPGNCPTHSQQAFLHQLKSSQRSPQAWSESCLPGDSSSVDHEHWPPYTQEPKLIKNQIQYKSGVSLEQSHVAQYNFNVTLNTRRVYFVPHPHTHAFIPCDANHTPQNTSAEIQDYCMLWTAVCSLCTQNFLVPQKHKGLTLENQDF